ncbi:MAG: NUDIX domain-containing protein [Patescibacteria group bacterium]
MVNRHWVSVGAAIYDETADAFLLIQRFDNSLWQLPGGLVEVGERLSEAVIRETLEETGVEVTVQRPSGIYESPNHSTISIVFACSYVAGELRPSSESRSVAWVGRLAVADLVQDAYSCRILDALGDRFQLRTTDEVGIIG